jgi:acetyltransferase-like isoleucine patch superfamily enzyme
MESVPEWVTVGAQARIHHSVVFVPFGGKKLIIGKRVKIDSGSVIYGGVEIGNDSIVGHNTVIRQNTSVGVHSVIANLCMLEGNTSIGEHTLIHSNNHLGQKTKIGNYVFMAPLCVTTNDPKMYYYRKEYSQSGEHWKLLEGPSIEDGVRIAVGVIFFPKIHVGKQAVIGAGTVVTKDVPDYAVVFGVPGAVRDYVKKEDDIIVRCTRNHN